MFPSKGPSHYGQQPPYGGQQPYGQIVRLSEESIYVCFCLLFDAVSLQIIICVPAFSVGLLLHCSLVALDLQHRQRWVAPMVVGSVPELDRGLLRSMAGRTLQFMAHNRWLTVTEICSIIPFSKIEDYMRFIKLVVLFLSN
jgi:hypothetical protein